MAEEVCIYTDIPKKVLYRAEMFIAKIAGRDSLNVFEGCDGSRKTTKVDKLVDINSIEKK